MCLLVRVGLMGQNPVANFTAPVTSGCAPLTVSFTDQSTGSPKFWNWDFGNGNLSTLQNPVIVYSNPGVYSVTLVVRNATGADGITKTGYIVVNPSPTASFDADKKIACAPADIHFTDFSRPNAGSIVQWQWNFGDGSTSTVQNPSHQYTNTGFYDVTLTVTSSTGCKGTISNGRFVRIVPSVKADFLSAPATTCQPPFNVSFSNQTSGPGLLTYNWDLGNATTSTQTNPSTIYAANGTYTVKLTAQSEYGCQNTVQKNITVATTLPTFTWAGACLGSPVAFQNTSSPSPQSVLWRFPDGTTSTLNNPSKTFNTPGTYPVKLIGKYAACTDTTINQVTVNPLPTVNFTAPRTKTCKPDLKVDFQDLSPAATTWKWDFGDGSPVSTVKNPSHTYTSTGVFNVTLTITDAGGCENTIMKTAFVQVVAPSASIGNVPTGGCVPFDFTPNSNSAAVDGIVSYNWDFGDGNTSTLASPTNHYASTGNYTVKLTITTTDGCTSTISVPNAVNVGSHANPDFTKDMSPVCRSSAITFNYTSTPPGIPAFWKFGDGDSSYLPSPKHKYSDTGSFMVTLITNNNGCLDTISKPNFVTVLPPVAGFRDSVDCSSPNHTTVYFKDTSIVDPTHTNTYTWYWGSTVISSGVDDKSPSYTFPSSPIPARYPIRLVVDDGTCVDEMIHDVRIIDETPDFTINPQPVCRNQAVTFTSTNSPLNVKKYCWNINGRPDTTTNPTYTTTFTTAGFFNISLTLIDSNNCPSNSMATKQIEVTGPVINFTTSSNADGGCKDKPVQFIDQSTSTSPIIKWQWDFGDGSSPDANNVLQNPIHIYKDTGVYFVGLTVTDTRGCVERRVLFDTITAPKAFFGTDTTKFCPGGPMPFKDSSLGRRIISWTWDFGDQATANTQNPTHIYKGGDSVYSVKLVIRDAFGCADSLTRTNYVTIIKPKPSFRVKDSTTICPPLETQFFGGGVDYESFSWDFGDGGESSLLNPTHFFNTYGSYTVKLYVYGYGGCKDSAFSTVNVYNPNATTKLTYSPLNACNELMVDFDLTATPSTKTYVYFGDGGIDSTGRRLFQYFYSTFGYNNPLVLLVDSTGCQANVPGSSGTINILGSEPIFAMDRKRFCDSGTIYFTNFSVGNNPIASSTWNFGDGTIIKAKDATHYYSQPGVYVIAHTDTTVAGCTKTLYDTARVYATPHPFITSNEAVCNNTPITFQGNLTVPDSLTSWKWDFGNGKTDTIGSPTVAYSPPGNYMVHLTASNLLGCKDTTSKPVKVNGLPTITVAGDTSFIVGTGINIPLSYSSGVVAYSWTPATNLSCTDCPSPYANPKFTTTYKVTTTDSNGCMSSRNVTLISLCNNKNFFIPNTFSPNGDGVNDVFYPRGTGLDRIEGMRIFSRWGELVFEKKNFQANLENQGWNGTYKGKQAEVDTYVYYIDIVCENAVVITYKGNITLIR